MSNILYLCAAIQKLTQMKNPFQYGKVAEQENFIDRDVDRRFLKDILYSGTNVILISPRRWGKSSLVKKAMAELRDEHPEVKVVHLDAFPITSSQEFYAVFAREVLKATSSHIEALMDNVGRFLKNIAPKVSFSPEPMSEFSFSIEFGDKDFNPAEVLSLPERIAEDKGIQIIVCIDEFQRLARLVDYDKLESQMRSVWQHQQRVSYCLYGSQRHMMSDIFDSPEKPFYRFGQMYNLKKIASEDWVRYIQDRFKVTGKEISLELAQKITDIAECHSWYVQQIASAVWNFANVQASEESLGKALEWCIDVNGEAYQRLCENFTESQIGLLRAIASGETKLSASQTISKYRLGTSASVIKNKRQMANNDVITLSKTAPPQFLDPIFGLWFRQNYL